MSRLIEVSAINMILDLRYTTTNNFTGKRVFDHKSVILLPEVAQALQKVLDELKQLNLYLVVWDSYRSQQEQNKLLAVCDDDDYVSHISNHSKGITVDVTLADSTQKYLDMGTDFDEFNLTANPYSKQVTKQQQENRKTLIDIMKKFGMDSDAIKEAVKKAITRK